MPVPTHGPDCQTKSYWPMKCRYCGKRVIYWSCNHGSKVFFDSGYPDWIKHECSIFNQVVVLTPLISRQGVQEPNSINPLISCPYCEIKMRGRDLAYHIKHDHLSDPKFIVHEQNIQAPILDGIEIQSPNFIHAINHYVVDESGFILPNLSEKKNRTRNFEKYSGSTRLHRQNVSPKDFDNIKTHKIYRPSQSKLHRVNIQDSHFSVGQTHDFADIKSIATKITGARIKKIRPEPNQEVDCPICYKAYYYQDLFEHVSISHKDKKAKVVLAIFNQEYERMIFEKFSSFSKSK